MNNQGLPSQPESILAVTARDVLTENLISISSEATVREAIDLLGAHVFRAAPVIDEGGHAIGVVSQIDILIHSQNHPWLERQTSKRSECATDPTETPYDQVHVKEIMTPFLFTVPLSASIPDMIEKMKEQNVHHLFVTDDSEDLVGVISTIDLLKRL